MFSKSAIQASRVWGGWFFAAGLFFLYGASAARAAPTLGNYPHAIMANSTSTFIFPLAAPANVVRATAFTPAGFKGVLTVNPATGAIRITNAYPVGNYQIVVSGFDAANARVTVNFNLTVRQPAGSCSGLVFNPAPGSPLTVGSVLRSVAVGDFNDDNLPDLTSTVAGSDSLSVLIGNGVGAFSPPAFFATGSDPVAVAVGDFNGDGHQDLANANEQTNFLTVLLGNGAGGFAAGTSFFTGADPRSIAVGDFNADGRADLVTANFGVGNVSVLLGNGDGTFQPAAAFPVGLAPVSVAVGDFNGDGRADIATANLNSGNVSVLLRNAANSGFLAAQNLAAGAAPVSITAGDFNADGRADIAALNNQSNNVSVFLRNAANSGFEAAANYPVGAFPMFVTTGDFNHDGRADLVAANRNTDNVSILVRNPANDGFEGAINFPVGDMPWAIAVGDLNFDGREDLAVANFFSGNISLLFRQCLVPSAASVEIGGRVRTIDGRAIAGARVTLTNSDGATRTALANSFGFYRFADVPTGETYVLSVAHKRYVFGEPAQVHFIEESREDLDFTALPEASALEKPALDNRRELSK
jgi:hypothetical protein